MRLFSLPYGTGSLEFSLPLACPVDEINPPAPPSIAEAALPEKIKLAMQSPLGEKSLSEFQGVKTVGIAVNDKTRPVPNDLLLPPLLEALADLGIAREQTCFFIANGTHAPMVPAEFGQVLPQHILDQYEVVSPSCDDIASQVDLGLTSRGTPVKVNRRFYQCGLKIVVGNIEPHYFAGFSGGCKTAAIGLSSRETVTHNHAMLVDPRSDLGMYLENPVRQDIEEIGDKIGVDFALNAVLSGERTIAEILFGQPRQVMLAGVPIAQTICQTPTRGGYDLVIASAGGHPKDINLYQAQKGMTHAALLVRNGGILILAAACPEGIGSATYEKYMVGKASHEQILATFLQDGFKIGPHKAFLIARMATRIQISLVSEITDEQLKKFLLHPVRLQPAIDQALQVIGPDARIAVMAHAASTIPVILVN